MIKPDGTSIDPVSFAIEILTEKLEIVDLEYLFLALDSSDNGLYTKLADFLTEKESKLFSVNSPVIVDVVFESKGRTKVKGVLSDGSIENLFSYYPDELSFSVHELTGLTVNQAKEIWKQKDLNYLRS